MVVVLEVVVDELKLLNLHILKVVMLDVAKNEGAEGVLAGG